jgi:hypothetical protein
MRDDRRADLTLTPTAAGWRISLKGGSSSADGAGAAADCELEAEGPLRDQTIAAQVVPFEGTDLSVSAQDLAAHPAHVTVKLTPEGATVTTDFAGCGVGADLSGRYVRARQAAEAAPDGAKAEIA